MAPEPRMFDFHVHTTQSDGALIPAETFRRAQVRGIDVLGLADHTDFATTPRVVGENLQAVLRERELGTGLIPFCGVELTHVRPPHIAHLVETARQAGAEYVVVHGESPVEPVEAGTNRAAIEAGCDILAHPGMISEENAGLAAEKGVLLEISSKAGHSLANGHVAGMAQRCGALLIFGSDSHEPGHMHSLEEAARVLRCAGLDQEETDRAFVNARSLFDRLYQKYVEDARNA